MAKIQGSDRFQLQMICIENCVSEQSPARVVDAFVEYLDIDKLGYQQKGKGRNGRPAFQTRHLLKLYLYGYLNKVRSSRRLERECRTNMEAMWLLDGVVPCYKTIADFRKDNAKALKQTFRQLFIFLRGEGLFQGDVVAIDGSKFRAQNSKKNNYNERKVNQHLNHIEKQTQKWLTRMDEVDGMESNEIQEEQLKVVSERLDHFQTRKDKYESLAEQLKEVKPSGQRQISSVDADARALPKHMGIVEVGYNVQSTVDLDHKLVVDFEVGNELDTYALSRNAIRAKELLEKESLKVLADKGYDIGVELKACADNGIETYIAPRNKNTSKKLAEYTKDKFEYNHDKDHYLCPAGEVLTSTGKWYKKNSGGHRKPYRIKVYKTAFAVCDQCQFKLDCAGQANLKNSKGRPIERSEYDDYLEDNRERVRLNKPLYRKRQSTVEHPFGTIKRQWGYDHTLVKGKQKVAADFSLIFTSYNLRRAMSIFGIKSLIKRLKTAFLAFSDLFAPMRQCDVC